MDVSRRTALAGGAVVVWCLLVAVGAREIYGYSTTEGGRAATPVQWPAQSTLAHSTSRPTILMFVHPECPCSRASFSELAAVLEPDARRALVQIVFDDVGGTWDMADRVRGATRVLDRGGMEAARFGARTSGHVVVYDVSGALRYSGGITGARGHAGDNVGRRTVAKILAGDSASDLAHAVFGCAFR